MSGVSTRKVTQIVEELCGKTVAKSFVSDLATQLDPMVKEWQHRSLSEISYPFLMTDVLYIKVRVDHRVVSKSCHIALGINEQGNREIIGLMIQNGKSETSWTNFFDYLKNMVCMVCMEQSLSYQMPIMNLKILYRCILVKMSGAFHTKCLRKSPKKGLKSF